MYPDVPSHKFDPFEVRKKKRYPDTPAFILCQESCNDNMGISFQFASDVKILLKIERYFQAEALGMLSGMKFDSIKADNGSGWVKPPPRFAPLLQDAGKEYPRRDLRMKTLMDISSSLGNLVKLYATKNDLSSVLEEKSLP
ncbi:unnamed protein product [Aphanomyces euteiches]